MRIVLTWNVRCRYVRTYIHAACTNYYVHLCNIHAAYIRRTVKYNYKISILSTEMRISAKLHIFRRKRLIMSK